MAPVPQPDANLVSCDIEPTSFLAAIRKIAKAVSEDTTKLLLSSVHVKQNITSTDERNVSDRAVTLFNGLIEMAKDSKDFNTLINLLSYDFDTSTPKRQCDNDESSVEAKRSRTSVNEVEENSHGDTNNDNNQPSTSGVREMEQSRNTDNVRVSTNVKVPEKKTRSKKNKLSSNRGSTSSRTKKSYENSPSKGLTQCVFCAWCRPGIEAHYRETHNVWIPRMMWFYDGTPLFTRRSNINTEDGKATWFITRRKEAEKKYEDQTFQCRLCHAELGDKELLERHYINRSHGHQVDKSRLSIVETLFELTTENPHIRRKSRSTGSGKDRSEFPDDNVSAQELNTGVESANESQSRPSIDRTLSTQDPLPSTSNHYNIYYGPMIKSVFTVKPETNDNPHTADDRDATHTSVDIKDEVD